MSLDVPSGVRRVADSLDDVPAYVYDLAGLSRHAAAVRAALAGTELCYAVKANPDPEVLRALAPYADGFEVSSGGEFEHVRALLPDPRLSFGGPGKTGAELALAPSAHRWHVESPAELRRLRGPADVLLRVNLDVPVTGAALAMGGGATPFGMDPDGVAECLALLGHPVPGDAASPGLPELRPGHVSAGLTGEPDGPGALRLRGVHAHLASGLAAPHLLTLAEAVLAYGRSLGLREFNLGGGMAVSYTRPEERFDWAAYGAGLRALARPGETLRVEPGRALTAYCGWYLTTVLDVKRVHGERFAVLSGGTHHLRTPVTKGHDQPFAVLPRSGEGEDGPVTLVGRLCTPKDVFARRVTAALAVGDIVAFAMAGAYAWNISHHDFLMHPKPEFHYLR
ncbi:type III PLP-dependent enzyme [Microbispora triticiradicis]|uniref:type III PLP-dependent enzyme n=1 Tax=Microbispora triticiradicis TaxID=2200763 RepID=UPI001AD68FFB|nr:type III PLP-dependent enzyme [Microbispora triticiradicis]MBO4273865.1 type III PLP-dependent enzyme [Microbispora triticiradicis]